MPKPLTPLHTHEPWLGFGPRDRKRAKPLPVCPAEACRRAKACIRATDGHFCQRTHQTPAEIREQARNARGAKPQPRLPTLARNPTPKQIEAYRILSDHMVAEAEARAAAMRARWQRGELDHLYGPYNPKGVTLSPPVRRYVEEGAPRRLAPPRHLR